MCSPSTHAWPSHYPISNEESTAQRECMASGEAKSTPRNRFNEQVSIIEGDARSPLDIVSNCYYHRFSSVTLVHSGDMING